MNIKIFISCHKKCALLRNKYVYPVQVGTALAQERFEDMYHDDEGVNISDLNPMYCELTAQYWAWKNIEADYYGFMHYRRYFSLNSDLFPEDQYGNVVENCISESTIQKLHLTEKDIENIVPRYDVITLIPNEMSKLGGETVYEHAQKASPFHRMEDLEEIISIINKKYPEFSKVTQEYLNGTKGYFCNMYIMKKQIFNDYCAWLFDILDTHRKQKSFDDYSVDEYRVSGFWAERLWGIYYTYLKENKSDIKFKEVQKTFFVNTNDNTSLKPAFKENNIPVVFAADNNYVPIISTALRSILENASQDKNYDFIVLQQNITESNQQKLINEFCAGNSSVRFLNVKEYFDNRKLVTPAHFTIEIYYRLVMQDVLVDYDKVIYLDSDLVVNEDISKLFDIEIGDNLLGAVKDVDSAGCYKEFDPKRKEYFERVMKLENPYTYFNSGVLIMNLKEFRKTFTTEDILKMAESEDYIFPDQDVLNIICEKKVYYLDESWNTMMNHSDGNISRLKVARMAPHAMYSAYLEARKHPKIIHYAGYQKPWIYCDCDMAEYFWKNARKTNFYEILIGKLYATKVADKCEPMSVKKKNLIVGGIQCIRDHGFIYTCIYSLKKLNRFIVKK